MSRSIHPSKIEVREVAFPMTHAQWKKMSCAKQACFAATHFNVYLDTLPYEKDRFRIGKLALSTQGAAPFVHCTLERGGGLTAIYCVAEFIPEEKNVEQEDIANDEESDCVSCDERDTESE